MAASPASSTSRNISTSRRSGSRPVRRLWIYCLEEWQHSAAAPSSCSQSTRNFGAEMNFPSLFSPLKIGPYQLQDRVVMAPLTRMRAEKPSLAPRPLNAEYYAQRATSGGVIFLQLWHVGRVSHSSFQPGGVLPVAPSAVPIPPDLKTGTADGKVTVYETPRALETSEIPGIVEAYRQAARNALKAGFDGVEVHGANGYLCLLYTSP